MQGLHITPAVHYTDEGRTTVQTAENVAGESLEARLILGKIALEVRQSAHRRSKILPQFDFLRSVLPATDEHQTLFFVSHY